MAFLQLIIFGESQQKQQDGHQEHDNRLRPGTRPGGPGGREATEMGAPVPRCPEEQEKAHKPPAAPRWGSCSPAVARSRNTAPHGSAWVSKGNQKTVFFL